MLKPNKGCKVHQAWKENRADVYRRYQEAYKVGDVLEDILLPRQKSHIEGGLEYSEQHRFRLWRAKIQKIGPKVIDFGIPETYVIRPDDERVLDYIKARYMPHENELEEECP